MEYKNIDFYNQYFDERTDFVLKDSFHEIKTRENGSFYIGVISPIESIHPIDIRVEIPPHFPHQKLMLWTYSIFGYPHLIGNGFLSPKFSQNPSDEEKELQKKDWSWFCLNSPFAESAEEQLNIELSRLKDWMDRQLSKDLPAIITDEEFIKALRRANSYDWEVPNNESEFIANAKLTLVGDYFNNADNFKERLGKLHCIRNESKYLYAFEDKTSCNAEIPYVIEDAFPQSLNDLCKIIDQYKWDENICKHILPNENFKSLYTKCVLDSRGYSGLVIHEEEGLQLIEEAKNTLNIPAKHKTLVYEAIEKEKETLLKEHKVGGLIGGDEPCPEMPPEREDFNSEEEYQQKLKEWEEKEQIYLWREFLIEKAKAEPGIWHSFALGVSCDGEMLWLIFSTNAVSSEYEKFNYNIGTCSITIKELISQWLRVEKASRITPKEYFGRAAVSGNIASKEIAILGVGAIGSILTEALVRSGVKHIGLWDGDIVEPGNLCRSTYTKRDLGNSKVQALWAKIKEISPFCTINSFPIIDGRWNDPIWSDTNYRLQCKHMDFYGSVNYESQENVLKQLDDYDIIIDCTGSNELLHFLSYSITEKPLYSLCITNKAKNLVVVSNNDGNPFELRKMYLSKLEQDTKNYYMEGSGCFSPTFIASYSDISALVSLACHNMAEAYSQNEKFHSSIISYDKRGIIIDRILSFSCTLPNGKIKVLNVSSETLLDIEELDYTEEFVTGFLFGNYSRDNSQIIITHCVNPSEAPQKLDALFKRTNGIIDYLGDITYSCEQNSSTYKQLIELEEDKSQDEQININNPVVAMKDEEGNVSFHLYFNGCLIPFTPSI